MSGTVEGVLTQPWQELVAGGNAATFGANLLAASADALRPTAVTVNGQPCTLVTR